MREVNNKKCDEVGYVDDGRVPEEFIQAAYAAYAQHVCVCVCASMQNYCICKRIFSLMTCRQRNRGSDRGEGQWEGRGTGVFKNLNGDVCRFVFIEIATQTRRRR